MILQIPRVLTPDEAADFVRRLADAPWADGRITAGPQSGRVKANQQLPEDGALARFLGERLLKALSGHPRFVSAALPRRVYPPLFNRYGEGMAFGDHVDNAIRMGPQGGPPYRTDLSATLFLNDPESYDGGELCFGEGLDARAVKLPAGDLVLYPASTVHRVNPVTRGVRLAGVFWVESLVADATQRDLLFDLDAAIGEARRDLGDGHAVAVRLVGAYHNLVRLWART